MCGKRLEKTIYNIKVGVAYCCMKSFLDEH